MVVARTGFEPVISALRGRCPWPLDERATLPKLQSNGLAYQSPTTNPWLPHAQPYALNQSDNAPPLYISSAAALTSSISAAAGTDNARPRNVISPVRSTGKM